MTTETTAYAEALKVRAIAGEINPGSLAGFARNRIVRIDESLRACTGAAWAGLRVNLEAERGAMVAHIAWAREANAAR